MASNKREMELFEAQIKDIRQQLTDQAKTIEFRAECEIAMLSDVQEFIRRKIEIELDYSRNLEKLSDKFKGKIAKKESACVFDLFNKQLNNTKAQSKFRSSSYKKINALYVGQIGVLTKEIHCIAKRCREIQNVAHEESIRVLHELLSSMKNYHTCQAQSENAQRKLAKIQNSGVTKRQDRKKADRSMHKSMQKCTAAKLRSINARNDYILNLYAANALYKKYFDEGIPEILRSLDLGYQNEVSQIFAACNAIESKVENTCSMLLESFSEDITKFKAEDVIKKFLDSNRHVFQAFADLIFISQGDDEVREIECNGAEVSNELDSRYLESDKNRRQLQNIVDEAKDALAKSLASMPSYTSIAIEDKEDISDSNIQDGHNLDLNVNPRILQCFQSRQQSQSAYLKNFKIYSTTKILQTMADTEHQILLNVIGIDGVYTPNINKVLSDQSLLKVFGGEIIDYLEATRRKIPLVVESCISYITNYGLNLQGIFRLSGSSVDINSLKEQFEKGKDPLKEVRDPKYVHAAAGVLKCYFRELQTPLFPPSLLEDLMECLRQGSQEKRVAEIKSAISNLPHVVVVVMRNLFNFLHLVTEKSDQNKMTAANLSLVFGPTLMRLTDEKLIAHQMQVNNVMEVIIQHSETIFPQEEVTVKTKLIDLGNLCQFLKLNSEDRLSFYYDNEEITQDLIDEFQNNTLTNHQAIADTNRRKSKNLSELEVAKLQLRRTSSKSDEPILFVVGPERQESSSTTDDGEKSMRNRQDLGINILAVANCDFESKVDSELSFAKGDSIRIVSQSNDGIWIGICNETQGIVRDQHIEFLSSNLLQAYAKNSVSQTGSTSGYTSEELTDGTEDANGGKINGATYEYMNNGVSHNSSKVDKKTPISFRKELINEADNESKSAFSNAAEGLIAESEGVDENSLKSPKKKKLNSRSPVFKKRTASSKMLEEKAKLETNSTEFPNATPDIVSSTPQRHF